MSATNHTPEHRAAIDQGTARYRRKINKIMRREGLSYRAAQRYLKAQQAGEAIPNPKLESNRRPVRVRPVQLPVDTIPSDLAMLRQAREYLNACGGDPVLAQSSLATLVELRE